MVMYTPSGILSYINNLSNFSVASLTLSELNTALELLVQVHVPLV